MKLKQTTICLCILLFSTAAYCEVVSLDCETEFDGKVLIYKFDIDKDASLSDVTLVRAEKADRGWTAITTKIAPSTITLIMKGKIFQISRKDLSFNRQVDNEFTSNFIEGQCKKVERAEENLI